MVPYIVPFALIGIGFLMLLVAGLLMNGKQCAIALDQWVVGLGMYVALGMMSEADVGEVLNG